MQLPPYIYVNATNEIPGAGIVIMTSPPCYVGKVLKIKNKAAYDSFISSAEFPVGILEHYRICVLIAGTWNNEYPVGTDHEVQLVVNEMADWYYQNKIANKPHGFLDFLKMIFT